MSLNTNANYTFQPSSSFNLVAPLTIQTDTQSMQYATANSQWSPFSTPSFSPYQSSVACASKNFFQYSSSFASPTSNRQHAAMPFSFNHASPKRTTQNSCLAVGSFSGGNSEMRQKQFLHIQRIKQPKRSDDIDMSFYIKQAALQRALGARVRVCSFCKSNDEQEIIYTSHSLKDADDNITCPILLRLRCPICGASGEKAHTKKYCPVLQKKLRYEMLNKISK